jgi:hypothetical protein
MGWPRPSSLERDSGFPPWTAVEAIYPEDMSQSLCLCAERVKQEHRGNGFDWKAVE